MVRQRLGRDHPERGAEGDHDHPNHHILFSHHQGERQKDVVTDPPGVS